jgi:hypothetical protein
MKPHREHVQIVFGIDGETLPDRLLEEIGFAKVPSAVVKS